MNLQEHFQQWIEERRLSAGSQRFLLAVSGGVDSMVLLHLFCRFGLEPVVAHCNFQLRGADSDLDAGLVENTAQNWGARCFVRHFDTRAQAATRGVSIQMAARDLRYEWFGELAAELGITHLATAHHLDDSVETALLNFTRGTGLAGLAGIRDRSAGNSLPVLRPLLQVTKSEVLEYARSQGIVWREDASNASDDYMRNAIRLHVVPRFLDINPNFLHTAERNLQRLASANDNLLYLLKRHLQLPPEGNRERWSLSKQLLIALPSPRHALRVALQPYGFTEEQTRQLAENLHDSGLELLSNSGWRLVCDREQVLLQPVSAETEEKTYPETTITIGSDDLMIRLPDGRALFFTPTLASGDFPDGKNEILLAQDQVVYPMQLRRWAPGDAFQPFGMGGKSQKLQDFFTNLKLSRLEKENVLLLINGDGRLIWVLGWRSDERFRIVDAGQAALKCSLMA